MAKGHMAPDRRPTGRDAATVWLPRDLIQMAKVVATHRGQPMIDLLTDMIRGPLTQEYRASLTALNDQFGGEGD